MVQRLWDTGGSGGRGRRQKRGGIPGRGEGANTYKSMYPAWWTEVPEHWGLSAHPPFSTSQGAPMRINVEDLFAAAKHAERVSVARPATQMGVQDFLGEWMDSLGNAVSVYNVDAYEIKLVASLSRPPRADIHLSLRPAARGNGWQCGNSVLDTNQSSSEQLYWLTGDGRVSVWVKLRGNSNDSSKDGDHDTDCKVSKDTANIIDAPTGTEPHSNVVVEKVDEPTSNVVAPENS